MLLTFDQGPSVEPATDNSDRLQKAKFITDSHSHNHLSTGTGSGGGHNDLLVWGGRHLIFKYMLKMLMEGDPH